MMLPERLFDTEVERYRVTFEDTKNTAKIVAAGTGQPVYFVVDEDNGYRFATLEEIEQDRPEFYWRVDTDGSVIRFRG